MSIQVLDGEKVYLGSAEPSSGGGGSVNNEDLYITTNGVYTAGEGYTGIGTATVNVPLLGDIVSAKNATGAAITAGDKVWIEKVTGGWNMVTYEFSSANSFTGTATENIASGSLGNAKTVLPEQITVSVTANADDAQITVA